jgi:hypothetical protein
VLACLLLGGRAAAAQEVAVPVDVQVPLLVKVLGFDRKLASAAEEDLVVGVLYQGKFRTSVNVAAGVQEAIKRLPGSALAGRRVRGLGIDLDDTPTLGAALSRLQVSVLYVSPLRAVDLRAVMSACRSAGVTTVTGVTDYVETGLAIGIGAKGDRPEIVINLAASRAEGADLNAQLLKLARIVK